jgi:hypothetical protein
MQGVSSRFKCASKSTYFNPRRNLEPEYCHVTSPAKFLYKTVIDGFMTGI